MNTHNKNQEIMNYLGKIVISGGRKAKVINETQNQLEIVFQGNGKYQGNIATVKKGEVALLDKRKNPEKYPLSAEEKKIERYLNDLSRQPGDVWLLARLKDTLLNAEKKWADIIITRYRKNFDEARGKYYLVMIEETLNNLLKNPQDINLFFSFQRYLFKAKEDWADVSQYEKIFYEMCEKYYITDIENKLSRLQKDVLDSGAFMLATIRIKRAKELWIDVGECEKIFYEINKKRSLIEVKKRLKNLQTFTFFWSISLFKEAINDAKKFWNNVDKYEKIFYNVAAEYYLTKLKNNFNILQNDLLNKEAFESCKTYIKKAQENWINVDQYQKLFPEISKKHYLATLEDILKYFQENPSYHFKMGLFKTYIEESKEDWIDVSKYEKFLREFYKNYYLVNSEEELKKLEEKLKTLEKYPQNREFLEWYVSHLQAMVENWIDVSKYTKRFQNCLVKARKAKVSMSFIRDYPEVDEIYRQAMKPIEDKFVFGS